MSDNKEYILYLIEKIYYTFILLVAFGFYQASPSRDKIIKGKPFELKGKIYKCSEVSYE